MVNTQNQQKWPTNDNEFTVYYNYVTVYETYAIKNMAVLDGNGIRP